VQAVNEDCRIVARDLAQLHGATLGETEVMRGKSTWLLPADFHNDQTVHESLLTHEGAVFDVLGAARRKKIEDFIVDQTSKMSLHLNRLSDVHDAVLGAVALKEQLEEMIGIGEDEWLAVTASLADFVAIKGSESALHDQKSEAWQQQLNDERQNLTAISQNINRECETHERQQTRLRKLNQQVKAKSRALATLVTQIDRILDTLHLEKASLKALISRLSARTDNDKLDVPTQLSSLDR
jgi:hypothetical protein